LAMRRSHLAALFLGSLPSYVLGACSHVFKPWFPDAGKIDERASAKPAEPKKYWVKPEALTVPAPAENHQVFRYAGGHASPPRHLNQRQIRLRRRRRNAARRLNSFR